jgi:ribosomal protein S6
MEKTIDNEEIGAEKEPRLYEFAYLLNPLITEEKLADEINILRSIIEEKANSLILSEEAPKSRKLAYPIKKVDTAYFGWIRFMSRPDAVFEVKNEFDKNKNILRFLIILAKQEAAPRKPMKISKPKKPAAVKAPKPEEKQPIVEEEIDKKLEELIGV